MNEKSALSPNDRKVWLVGREAEHYEVRVRTAQAVPRVRVVAGRRPLPPNVVHDLVLAFA